MSNATLIKAYTAPAAIAAYRIVKFNTAASPNDREVAVASAGTDFLIGVNDRIAAAAGERCEVVRAGIAAVEYGGAVVRGAMLTADSDGKAVSTVAANRRIIGVAEISGADGDIGEVLISPSLI